MAQERPRFNVPGLTSPGRILLASSLLYLVVSVLPYWQRLCVDVEGISACVSATGWEGVGILAGLLAVAILIMEFLVEAKVEVNVGTPAQRLRIEALAAGGVLLFTILRIAISSESLSWASWLGLIVAVAVAYGGLMRLQEAGATPPPAG